MTTKRIDRLSEYKMSTLTPPVEVGIAVIDENGEGKLFTVPRKMLEGCEVIEFFPHTNEVNYITDIWGKT